MNLAQLTLLLSLASGLLAQTARAQNPPKFNPPKAYYLALGDSVTYGYQAFKDLAHLPPSAYNTGFVDVFSARLRQIRPGITTVNYGCPGESTDTFINGGCIWIKFGRQLHDSFSGSQLQAALTFLNAHPGQVSPITLNLGGNDVPNLVTPCTFNNRIDLDCVRDHAPAFIADLVGRISGILHDLRSAAPDAEIILIGSADTSLGALAFADPLFQLFNTADAGAAAANRAWFANPFLVFNPQGDPAVEVQTLCTLTLLCSQGDIHPSDAGYQALARIVFDASQYARLAE